MRSGVFHFNQMPSSLEPEGWNQKHRPTSVGRVVADYLPVAPVQDHLEILSGSREKPNSRTRMRSGVFYTRFSIYFLEVKILIERESFIVIFLAGILHNSHSLKSEKVENCAVFVMDAEKKS